MSEIMHAAAFLMKLLSHNIVEIFRQTKDNRKSLFRHHFIGATVPVAIVQAEHNNIYVYLNQRKY